MRISRRAWLAAAGAAVAAGQTKRSVAVDEFDYSAVMTAAQAIFGTQVNLGAGIRALLVKRIAQDGKFTIVERAKVNTLIKEQDFGASGRVKKGTQARIGQIRGADYTLMGDIVVFGRDDRSTRVGGGVGGLGRRGARGRARHQRRPGQLSSRSLFGRLRPTPGLVPKQLAHLGGRQRPRPLQAGADPWLRAR